MKTVEELILWYLYQGKEQDEFFYCADSEALTEALKNHEPSVTEEQVYKAVKRLHEGGYIDAVESYGEGGLSRLTITIDGEKSVESKGNNNI